MAATATRRIEEPPLSKEVGELYDKLWKIGRESLQALGFETLHFDRMRDYKEVRRMIDGTGDAEPAIQLNETLGKLNAGFARKNGLPERINDEERVVKFLSEYARARFGREIDIFVSKEMRSGAGADTIWFSEGTELLHAIQ